MECGIKFTRCILLIDFEVVKIWIRRCDFCFGLKARCSGSFFEKFIASVDIQSKDGIYTRREFDFRCTFFVFVLLQFAQYSTTNKKSIIEDRKKEGF